MQTIRETTSSYSEPFAVQDLLDHMRFSSKTPKDVHLLPAMLAAARIQCEHALDRAIGTRTYEIATDEFVDGLRLLYPPFVSLDSVVYDDADDVEQTLAGVTVRNHQIHPTIILPDDLPTTNGRAGCVRITYTSGYSSIPENLKIWVMMRAAAMYENRESEHDLRTDVVGFVDGLLDVHRVPGV